ncbi:aspartyl protease family protein [Planctomycetota bacterium]
MKGHLMMTERTIKRRFHLILLGLFLLCGSPAWAQREGWEEKEVQWRAGRGRRIKRIYYPKGQQPQIREKRQTTQHPVKRRSRRSAGTPSLSLASPGNEYATTAVTPATLALEVNTPPVDGFVPWIAVVATDKRQADLEMEAEVEHQLVGRVPTGRNPASDYVIGLFDTGASGSVVGYGDAMALGLYSSKLVGPAETVVGGVVGAVITSVSYPLGLFVSGLQALDAQTQELDTTQLMGQSNVAVVVGQNPGTDPDLPTAIGAPMSVYYATEIRNDQSVTVSRGEETVTGPAITLHPMENPSGPRYENVIPLELRPLGGISVQYVPSTEGLLGGGLDDPFGDILGGSLDFPPGSPSVIIGNLSQSLYFVHSVDLYEGDMQILDKNRFMLDTGAQVTVVGSRLAARLRLDVQNPEFEVEIEGVTGNSVMAPGFNVDRLEIPALGNWFVATDVPVVLLDISSPEGGTLDGIIGMNLFVDFNLIVRGGGLFLGDDPRLELQPITSVQP